MNIAADYATVAEIIRRLEASSTSDFPAEKLAAELKLQPAQLEKLLTRWKLPASKRAPLLAKELLFSIERGKQMLAQSASLFDSSPTPHHLTLESGSVKEQFALTKEFLVEFGFHPTPFGPAFLAVTPRGICDFAYFDDNDHERLRHNLARKFPHATVRHNQTSTAPIVVSIFEESHKSTQTLSLYVVGTQFQVDVWRALLRIPRGKLTSYGKIAHFLDRPKGSQAIGQAVGANPIGYLIPCHRVIQGSGALGGFGWGTTRKQAMLAWESI